MFENSSQSVIGIQVVSNCTALSLFRLVTESDPSELSWTGSDWVLHFPEASDLQRDMVTAG